MESAESLVVRIIGRCPLRMAGLALSLMAMAGLSSCLSDPKSEKPQLPPIDMCCDYWSSLESGKTWVFKYSTHINIIQDEHDGTRTFQIVGKGRMNDTNYYDIRISDVDSRIYNQVPLLEESVRTERYWEGESGLYSYFMGEQSRPIPAQNDSVKHLSTLFRKVKSSGPLDTCLYENTATYCIYKPFEANPSSNYSTIYLYGPGLVDNSFSQRGAYMGWSLQSVDGISIDPAAIKKWQP